MWYKDKDGRMHFKNKRKAGCIVKPIFAPPTLKDNTLELQGMIDGNVSVSGTLFNTITITNWTATSATITVDPFDATIEENHTQ